MGVNTAVTRDGEKYNKLKRPDDFLTAAPIEKATVKSDPTPSNGACKRTLDDADITDQDSTEEQAKRPRFIISQDTLGKNGKQNKSQGKGKTIYRATNGESSMQSMFPGMIDSGDLSDESTNEALAYLRGVRSEASSIPNVLVASPAVEEEAPNRAIYENIRGDHRVIYEDGTWIARDPDDLQEVSSDGSYDPDPQDQYYKNLLRRYDTMRQAMHLPAKPPSRKGNRPSAKRVASAVPANRHEWLYILDREYPSPSLVAGMKERDVFNGLKYCAHSLDRFKSITKQKSCWIWSLLAKTPEYGTMDHFKIGTIRDLGHKAGQFGMRLRNGEQLTQPAPPGQKTQEQGDEGDDVEMWEADDEGVAEDGQLEDGELEGLEEVAVNTEDTTAGAEQPSERSKDLERAKDSDAAEDGEISSDAEMSMSDGEEEGEEREDPAHAAKAGPPVDDEPTTLEDARARLLAQLGDRLVQAPPPAPASRSRAEAEHHRLSRSYSSQLGVKDTHPETNGTRNGQGAAKKESNIDTDMDADVDIPDLNTRVTIDMILTVVAECYGQRDLLRFRDIWDQV